MSLKAKLIAGAVVLVAVVGFAVWYFGIRSDPAPEFELSDTTTSSAVADGGSTTSTAADTDGIDGSYVASVPDEGGAGYRIDEVLSGLDNTATARTTDVTGSMTIADGSLTAVEITVDMTTLASTDDAPGVDRRDSFIKGSGLETDSFPDATFVLGDAVDLGDPAAGTEETYSVPGDLTLHGVTAPVTVEITARLNEDGSIEAVGNAEIALADFDITPPDLGFVKVKADGELEFRLLFSPA